MRQSAGESGEEPRGMGFAEGQMEEERDLGLGSTKRRCAVGGVVEEARELVDTGDGARLPTAAQGRNCSTASGHQPLQGLLPCREPLRPRSRSFPWENSVLDVSLG